MLSLKFCPQMVTEIQHRQTPISSSMVQKLHFQRAQTIQLVIKLACAQNAKDVHAHAPVENIGKAHVSDARLWTQKSTHTSERNINDSGRPPTHF